MYIPNVPRLNRKQEANPDCAIFYPGPPIPIHNFFLAFHLLLIHTARKEVHYHVECIKYKALTFPKPISAACLAEIPNPRLLCNE